MAAGRGARNPHGTRPAAIRPTGSPNESPSSGREKTVNATLLPMEFPMPGSLGQSIISLLWVKISLMCKQILRRPRHLQLLARRKCNDRRHLCCITRGHLDFKNVIDVYENRVLVFALQIATKHLYELDGRIALHNATLTRSLRRRAPIKRKNVNRADSRHPVQADSSAQGIPFRVTRSKVDLRCADHTPR